MPVWTPLPPVVGITPGEHGARRDVEFLVHGAVRGGLEMLVLREPQLDERAYVALARRLAPLLGEGLVLHARHPAALAVAAKAGWGLHLPAGSPIEEARRRVRGRLGVSCHSPIEVAAARQAGADYVFLGPVYRPRSKPDGGRRPLGLAELRRVAASADIPVVALGGIDPRRARACRRAGAAAVAAIGAIFGTDATPEEVERATRALVEAASAAG